MKLTAIKEHRSPGKPACAIRVYGYSYSSGQHPYWSMQFYEKVWHVPMSPDLLDAKQLDRIGQT